LSPRVLIESQDSGIQFKPSRKTWLFFALLACKEEEEHPVREKRESYAKDAKKKIQKKGNPSD
jgi:hypothetical protein